MSSRYSFGRRSGTESTTSSSSSWGSIARPSIRGRALTWREKERRKKEPVLVEDFYSTYELDWDALRAWLAVTFPDTEFGEQYVGSGRLPGCQMRLMMLMNCVQDCSGDFYRFKIPRKLTEDEKAQIWYLRNDQTQEQLTPPGVPAATGGTTQ